MKWYGDVSEEVGEYIRMVGHMPTGSAVLRVSLTDMTYKKVLCPN